jgi:hypothetical protein
MPDLRTINDALQVLQNEFRLEKENNTTALQKLQEELHHAKTVLREAAETGKNIHNTVTEIGNINTGAQNQNNDDTLSYAAVAGRGMLAAGKQNIQRANYMRPILHKLCERSL